MYKTLAIETSCDDTSIGIISFDWKNFWVEKLLAYSQIQDHQKFWGVMPEVASRLHSEKIIWLLEEIWRENIEWVDSISVTTHPGLPGSLLVGKTVASTLSSWFDKKMIEINHIDGHIFSLYLERNIDDIEFPMVVLTASWWHNDIYLVNTEKNNENAKTLKEKFGKFKISHLGRSLDDAAGECFDKVARMLGWPYPGWAWIGEMALKHNPDNENQAIPGLKFKRIFLSRDKFDFSFSGMKSQVSILISELEKKWKKLSPEMIYQIAYEFQEATIEVLAKKLVRAGDKFWAKTLGIAGGVSANDRLWEYTNELILHKNYKNLNFELIKPIKKVYSTDNSAMIGIAWILKNEWVL